MAMVFVKQLAVYVFIALLAALLVGCGSSGPKNNIDKKPVVVPLKKSGDYMPKQQYDAAGKKIPYQSAPNPYLQDKTLVTNSVKNAFLKADRAFKKKNYDSAKKQFSAMTTAYPELSGPWVKLAKIAETNKDYPKALEYLQRATEVNANNINAWLALGLLQRQQGLFTQAQNSYVEALMVWKDFPEAHVNLAIVYDLYLNQPKDAQRHFEAYLFLTNYKDKQARKWLSEVKRRTKIKTSFIDNPPKMTALEATSAENTKKSSTASQKATSNKSIQK